MTRVAAALISVVALSAVAPTAGQDAVPSRPADLARVQAALGGGALAAVQAFTVTGTVTRRLGSFVNQSSVDIRSVLPNQFVVITRRTVDRGPMGSLQITEYAGFNGAEPIDVVSAPDAPFPVRIPGSTPATPAAVAAAQAALLRQQHARFVQVTLPLFAGSWSSYPLEFLAGSGTVPTDVVSVRSADGSAWDFSVDPATHLPAGLRWRGRPIAVASASATIRVGPDGRPLSPPGPPAMPAGDPTAGLPDVEWRIEIDDYKPTDGLTWPHRFRTFVDGRLYEDLRLRDYRINPKIDPKIFTPTGR